MKTLLLPSLAKVFRDAAPNFREFSSFSCMKNERFSFQLAFMAQNSEETEITVSVSSPLQDSISLYFVKNIPAGKNGYDYSDSFHYNLNKTEFPDLLVPVSEPLKVNIGDWNSVWIDFFPTTGIVGKNEITLTLSSSDTTTEKTFTLNIINRELPKQELLYTNWFHNDCLCTYYGVEIFSDEYWKIAENYIQNASKLGVNMILTPIFTPPLDTAVGGERPTVQLVKVIKNGEHYSFDFENFKKYTDICLRNGIEAFEISHLFTQWGAEHAPKIVAYIDGKEEKIFGWETDASSKEYTDFLKQFAPRFEKTTAEMGIKERCWLHISDEPSPEQIDSYRKAANTVSKLFPDFKTLDALSDIDFYKTGLVKTPVCSEDTADIFKAETESFWTYHCCGQVNNNLPNRMFSQPSQRNRILGILLYKYNAEGFLQWGHNFWYSQYSRYPIDPFKVTDADNAFPSGDAFVVYPDSDGKPLNSLRGLVFADALQDLRALRLLEQLKSREYVLRLIEQGLDVPLSFKHYPHEQQWLLDLRTRINSKIEKLSPSNAEHSNIGTAY